MKQLLYIRQFRAAELRAKSSPRGVDVGLSNKITANYSVFAAEEGLLLQKLLLGATLSDLVVINNNFAQGAAPTHRTRQREVEQALLATFASHSHSHYPLLEIKGVFAMQ